jgi:hypothetical protein
MYNNVRYQIMCCVCSKCLFEVLDSKLCNLFQDLLFWYNNKIEIKHKLSYLNCTFSYNLKIVFLVYAAAIAVFKSYVDWTQILILSFFN